MANHWPTDEDVRTRLGLLIGSPHKVNSPIVVNWQGTTYRFATRNFSSPEHFIDGEGARRHGARFTPIGAQRTLYSSLEIVTAAAELESWYAYYCLPATAFQPRLLAAIIVSVGLVLDLTATETMSELGLEIHQICEEWRLISDENAVAPTQAFGKLIFEAGFEGILFPSVRRDAGCNLALFPDNFRDGSHAFMLNSD